MQNLRTISLMALKACLCVALTLFGSPLLLQAQSPTSLSYPTPNVFIANVSSVYLAPSVAGSVTSYSISQALPTGLSLNTNTGVISGIATVASSPTAYTVTATGGTPSGSTTAVVNIQVTNNYFNNAYNSVNFGGTGVTITNKVGDGTAVGNIVLYQNVASIGGQQIDAIVTTSALSNGTFTTYDQTAVSGTGYSENDPRFFSPQFNFTAAGSATFNFQFILGGSYNNTNNTGTDVVLQNVQINSYDIDGNGQANSNQYNEFGGFTSSDLGSATTVVPTFNAVTGSTNYKSNTTANSTSVIVDPTRVRVTYSNTSNFSIVVGTGGIGACYFFLDFGAGPAFSTAVSSAAPSIDLNTAITGVNNSVTGCGSSLAFTGSTQTNISVVPATLNELRISVPTANIVNGASEQLLIGGATSGGTIALNFTNAAAITNVVVGGITYTVTATVSGGTSSLTFTNNAGGTFTLAQAEALLDAMSYNNASATPTNGSRVFTVNVRNAVFQSPDATFTAPLSCVSISGNVYHDINGLTDNTISSSGTQFTANQVYVVRVNPTNNLVVDSKGIAAGGAYSFGTVTAGSYALYVSNTAPTAGTSFMAATYPTGGYVSTGENLGSGTGNDLLADGKLLVTVGSSSAAVSFGLEIPPVSNNATLSNTSNPGGYNNYTLANGSFNLSDADGAVSSITITQFPTGANYLKIGTTVYANPTGGACPPLSACTTWPGAVSVPFSGGNPTQAISIDAAADVSSSVVITYVALDDAGMQSNSTTLTIPFVVTNYQSISGNVWSDFNGNGIKDGAEPFTNTAASGHTLYAILVQNTNTYSGVATVFATSPVSATTGYSFTGVPAASNYELRLVSRATAPVAGSAAGVITANLAPGWIGVSTTNAGTIITQLNTVNAVIAISNLSATLAGVSFGIQQPAVADVKTYTGVNSGANGPLATVAITNTKVNTVTYVRSLTMAGTASGGNTPGMLSGSDPDGGTGGTSLAIGSGTAGFSLVIDPAKYTNTGATSASPTMLQYNGVQLQAGGCQGSDAGKALCSNYNAVTGFWEIPNYDGTLLKVLGTSGTLQMGFDYAWKDASGATGAFSNYNVAFNFALPLQLVAFDARNNGENTVVLQWKTNNEYTTSRFVIEYSTNGSTFAKAGTVAAAGAALSRSYSFTHQGAVSGNNYYRLAMYNMDGSFTYSDTRLVSIGRNDNRLTIQPNPVKSSATVTLNWKPGAAGMASVTVYAQSGRQVYQGTLDASGKAAIPVQHWPAGIYYITLENGKTKEFRKLLVE